MPDEMNYEADELETSNLGATPETEAPAGEATPAGEQTFIEAGGRKFKDQVELAKAYDGLLKDYSRTKGDFAKAKPWMDFGNKLNAHPELRTNLNRQIDEYVKRVQAGQSSTTAQKASGLPDQVADKISSLEARWEDMELQREIAEVKSKFNPDEDAMKEALKLSYDLGGVSLEVALKAVMHDKVAAKAQTSAEATLKQNLARKKAANVGSSSTPTVSPSQKRPEEMSRDESREAVRRAFWPEKYGS